jgi:hypothetical protein
MKKRTKKYFKKLALSSLKMELNAILDRVPLDLTIKEKKEWKRYLIKQLYKGIK